MKEIKFPIYNDPLIDPLLFDYFEGNHAAQVFLEVCQEQGWPVVIDHAALRCMNVEERAKVFLEKGYRFEDEQVEYPDQGWWAKVYRKPGLPVLFVDQAYEGEKGEQSIIPDWVSRFGEQNLHHVAVLVDNIEQAISVMENKKIPFSGAAIGSPGSRLRQIFTAAEVRDGAAYTVLELTERNGYTGFYPDQANALMQSSTQKSSQ